MLRDRSVSQLELSKLVVYLPLSQLLSCKFALELKNHPNFWDFLRQVKGKVGIEAVENAEGEFVV